MGRASVPTPAVYPAFFFVPEKGSKSAGNAVIPTFPTHWSHGLQHLRYKRPTFAFTDESECTLGSLRKIAHNGLHGETGAFRTGPLLLPSTVLHVHEHPRAGCQNGVLCRFWVLDRGVPGEHRKPSGQRCAYACRCPEASRPRWAALLCLQFDDVAVFSLCAQGFPHMRKRGWYHYPRSALRAAETPDGRLSKRLICRFLRSGGRSSPHDSYFLANTQNFLLAVPVANAFALWYDKFSKLEVVKQRSSFRFVAFLHTAESHL